MKYKFLSHTADMKFQAFGKNMEEMFGNAALAMFHSMYEGKVKEKRVSKIKASGKDFESLLYNFLEELLVLFDGEGFFLSRVEKMEISKDISDKGKLINRKQKGRAKKSELASKSKISIRPSMTPNESDKGGHLKLEAEVIGDDASNYTMHIDVKAITYHEMFVKKKEREWVCQVVMDV